MNIHYPPGVFADHVALNSLQVSGEHDEIDSEPVEQIQQLRPVVGRVESGDVDRCRSSTYEHRRVRAIGRDEHDARDSLARDILEVVHYCLKIRSAPGREHGESCRHPRFYAGRRDSVRPKSISTASSSEAAVSIPSAWARRRSSSVVICEEIMMPRPPSFFDATTSRHRSPIYATFVGSSAKSRMPSSNIFVTGFRQSKAPVIVGWCGQ